MTQSVTRGWFVTGTDTGVGKTVVSCALARGLRQLGLKPGVMKPSETGVGEAGPLDAIALAEAARIDSDIQLVCPQIFEMPAAPEVAARAEGQSVNAEVIRQSWRELRGRHEWMVVEGAGGLLVPIWEGADMADLALELRLPVVLVARGSLGTINHTLLSLEALDRRQIEVAGVVISHGDQALVPSDEANLQSLREALGDRLLGEIPPLALGELPETVCPWFLPWLEAQTST